MATTLYFNDTAYANQSKNDWLPYQRLRDSSNVGIEPNSLTTGMGGGVVSDSGSTIAGPTAGVEMMELFTSMFYSAPLSAAATISGTITLNLWAAESNMSANVAINAIGWKLTPTGTRTEFFRTGRTTELGTTSPPTSASNFTVTPTSTDFAKGDKILVALFGDDAGTMGSGYTFSVWFNGTTGGSNGDSYITFTENLTFTTSFGGGTTLYLTPDASDVSIGGQTSLKAWTIGPTGTDTATRTTVSGWTVPLEVQVAGTTTVWYTPQLNSATLTGGATSEMYCDVDVSSNCAGRWEVAVVDSDGLNPTILASASNTEATISAGPHTITLPLEGTINTGQRLRIKATADDAYEGAMATGNTFTVYLGSGTVSWIALPISVTEYSAISRTATRFARRTLQAVNRAGTY